MRTLLRIAIVAVTALCFVPRAASAQGLAERRAIKEYQEKTFPELKKQIDQAAGFDVKVTVHWNELALPGQAESYNQDFFISDIFFHPLIEALKSVTADQMGKDALKSGLKEIVIKYDPATAPISNYAQGWPFENGVLTLNYQPGVNSDGRDGSNYKERVSALKQILETKL